MTWNPDIIEALKRLVPAVPAESRHYVFRSAEVLGRGWDLPNRFTPLLLAESRFRGLLHGCTGAGKTTELIRWKEELRETATVVVVSVKAPREWGLPCWPGLRQVQSAPLMSRKGSGSCARISSRP